MLARHTAERHPNLFLEFGVDKWNQKFKSKTFMKEHKSCYHNDIVFVTSAAISSASSSFCPTAGG